MFSRMYRLTGLSITYWVTYKGLVDIYVEKGPGNLDGVEGKFYQYRMTVSQGNMNSPKNFVFSLWLVAGVMTESA